MLTQPDRRQGIDAVCRLARPDFVALLGAVFERSPWVAAGAYEARPFATVSQLHAAMVHVVHAAGTDAQLTMIRAHPDLAGKAAIAGDLTVESTREQSSAGLDRLSQDQFTRLTQLNTEYAARFGFPFVICAREQTADSIIGAAAQRVSNDPDTELRTALDQIAQIAALRLADVVGERTP